VNTPRTTVLPSLLCRWIFFTFLFPLFGHAQWQTLGFADSVRDDSPSRVTAFSGDATLQVEILSSSVARIRVAKGDTRAHPASSWAVIGTLPGASVKKVRHRDTIHLRTEAMDVGLALKPLRIRVVDGRGRLLNEDSPKGTAWSAHEVRVWKIMPPDEKYLGFGEKAGLLNRRETHMTMWNTDIPAYTADTDPLYQTIPFFYGITDSTCYGIFFDSPYRSSFDMGKECRNEYSFGAENGDLTYYFFTGSTPAKILEQFTRLVGTMPLPPRWSLGYQQSRWSYTPASRVREVAGRFRALHIPCDVLYLDIDYMEGYRIFTWNTTAFPQPRALLHDLADQGFKTVVIVDPGIKVDTTYHAYRSGLAGDHFVRRSDGSLFVGDVWPGRCAFPDFSNAEARTWWGKQFQPLLGDGIRGWWNDMNEPSVFNVPTKTMPLDNLHRPDAGATEHAAIHNVYGMQMTRATYEGVRALAPDVRPFVLTRASYAGGERYSAAWTGDNVASWEHLKMALTMCLNLGVSGQPFVGADIGGFIGLPTPELFARWLQLGVFTPLMRAHSAIGEPNKEPWEYGEQWTAINRSTIELRYRLLPYIYTVMEEASRTGMPAMRPAAFAASSHRNRWTSEEFFFGNDLFIAPVLKEGQKNRTVTLPEGGWYDFWTSQHYQGDTTITVNAPVDRIPFFARAGAAIATQQVLQFSDQAPIDPLTLLIYPPDPGGTGMSTLYEDDGNTFAYARGVFARRAVKQQATRRNLRITLTDTEGAYAPPARQLLLHIVGNGARPTTVEVNGNVTPEWTTEAREHESVGWQFEPNSRGILVKMPDQPQSVTVIITY
jgi:alpha-glucosidase